MFVFSMIVLFGMILSAAIAFLIESARLRRTKRPWKSSMFMACLFVVWFLGMVIILLAKSNR